MTYLVPSKAIVTPEQLEAWKQSETHERVLSYVTTLNDAVVGVKLDDECPRSPGVHRVLELLDAIEQLAKDTPPIDNASSRFGNPAFRTFYDKVGERAPDLLATIGVPADAVPEVATYLGESWGNRLRIDYGSGMELNFVCFLICLEQLGIVAPEDHRSLVIVVFWRYIQIMRVLQSTYWLEPAGSHGVWGLDDYHFLPFLFGSAQLKGHKFIRPKAIHDPDIVEEYAKHYMYFACIQFINSIKTASLRWHSPMLDDISAVKTWEKINSGMIKMYQAEVLHKLPVIQHFLFGSILPCPETVRALAPKEGEGAEDEHGHVHAKGEAGWAMDCCGIPVPSAFAAAQQDREKGKGIASLGVQGARLVPFD
ncbi:Phosphotyrosyl phosphatase activator [Schizophyllum commune Tattone D]|nr:Phosphotyrosyl phosphatase activator [Schizophyllum commune Loenen D]KAI5833312.1 Phosphotyrosyl phosphatase activator [Schizophyllum commune Tattone D]